MSNGGPTTATNSAARVALCATVWLACAGSGPAEAGLAAIKAGPLKVGIATADITPEGTVWMAGFAARKKPSEGIYKSLEATCVVFDNGATRLAFVAVDLCKIYEDQLADFRAAAAKVGIPPQHVMTNASHTHCGPHLGHKSNTAYRALFKTRTTPLLAKAVADLKPAALDYTVGACTMGINRRQLNAKGKCRGIRPEPRKPIDTDVPVLRVLSPDGKVRAVLFGYACHPTTMGGYRIGPDYPGFARDWVAAAWPGCVPVFLQGCGGDVKPRYTHPRGRFGYVLLDPVTTTASVGHELGRAVVAASVVPAGPVPADRPADLAKAVASPVQLGGIVELVPVPDKKNPKGKSHHIYVGAWRVGDVYVFGSQCEICSMIGVRIKRELRGLRVWTNGYTHWGGGYVPDAATYPEGGYEVNVSVVSPATEGIVVGNAIRYIRALESGKTGLGPIPQPKSGK